MPHRYKVKVYVENGFYHVYNRGVEKRTIFLDDQDYKVFLYLLKYFLSPDIKPFKHPLEKIPEYTLIRPRPLSTLYGQVDLMSYCLMPNHFHLLIKQITKHGMPSLLRKLSTTYAMYFNKRYKRIGYLFQGNYKATLITKDNYLLHLSRYIHLNPAKLIGSSVINYPYSSYAYFLGKKRASWIKPSFILSYFDSSRHLPEFNKFLSYNEFVEANQQNPRKLIGKLAID